MAGRLILDSGAVIAWQRGRANVWAQIAQASRRGMVLVIPAVVVAECIRGGPGDALIHRLLAAARVPLIGTRIALQAGRLLGEARMSATVDALIVAEAISAGPCVILTGDADDMKALVGGRAHVRIVPI
jgi:hypothetical protein